MRKRFQIGFRLSHMKKKGKKQKGLFSEADKNRNKKNNGQANPSFKIHICIIMC